MKKVISTLALAGMALVPALSGCSSSAPATATTVPPPVLSSTQAADIIAKYDRANNDVNTALNVAGVAAIEAAPLRTTSEAWLGIKKRLGQTVPLITSSDARYVVPSQAKWFIATANRVRGGVPSPRPTWTLFTASGDSWLATYSLAPLQDVPPPLVNSAGAAMPVTDFTDLAADPSTLGQVILDHYTKNLAGKDVLAKSAALDEQLSNGYRVGQSVLAGKGRNLTRSLDPATHPVYAVRTTDGGALAFHASTVIDEIRAQNGIVSFDATSNEAALLGSTGSAPQHTVTRLQMFLSYIPPRALGGQVTVLAYGDTPLSVR